jgi:replicative DNA helicase
VIAEDSRERALIGALLLHPDLVADLRGEVAPEDFKDANLGTVYAVLIAAAERGMVFNVGGLAAFMGTTTLAAVGGLPALAALVEDREELHAAVAVLEAAREEQAPWRPPATPPSPQASRDRHRP